MRLSALSDCTYRLPCDQNEIGRVVNAHAHLFLADSIEEWLLDCTCCAFGKNFVGFAMIIVNLNCGNVTVLVFYSRQAATMVRRVRDQPDDEDLTHMMDAYTELRDRGLLQGGP